MRNGTTGAAGPATKSMQRAQLRRRVGRHARVARQPRPVPLLRRSRPPRGGRRVRRHVDHRHLHVRRRRPRRGRRPGPGAGDGDPPAGRHGRGHRRGPGAGSPTTAPTGWSPATATGAGSQVLEEQGIHAEVTLPGPILAGGLSPAMYLGPTAKGIERGLAGPPRLRAAGWRTSAPPHRAAGPDASPIDFHDMDRAVEEVAWARQHGLFGGVMLPAMSRRPPSSPATPTTTTSRFWSACEDNQMVVTPAHRRLGHRPPTPSPLRRQARAACSGSTRCSSSPAAPSGS